MGDEQHIHGLGHLRLDLLSHLLPLAPPVAPHGAGSGNGVDAVDSGEEMNCVAVRDPYAVQRSGDSGVVIGVQRRLGVEAD